VYAKFSAAEKAKHRQLRNSGKERSTSSTGGKKTRISATNISEFASAISSAVSAISALSDNTKRTANEEETNDDPSTAQTLPWFARARSPNQITDPLPLTYLRFESFAWHLTPDNI
jgi:hypothetical protein